MTTNKMRAMIVAALLSTAACGGAKVTMTTDMAHPHGDMAPPGCVMNPQSGTDFLNACTSAQTGDPAKDAPYFPSLAPNGKLPSLP